MKKNQQLWVLGHKITPHLVSGNFDMVVGETPPNTAGPPPHFHVNMSEVFMVIEGEMDFVVDGKARKLGKGDSIDLTPNTLHTFKNSGEDTCTWINIHSPKGFMAFFEEMGIPDTEPNAIQKSVEDEVIGKVMQTAVDYDMHIKL